MEIIRKLYANTTVYRLFWTGITVGAGWAAAVFSGDPRWGLLVGALTQVITSEARERLSTIRG